jgi:signal peptidase I
LNVYIGKFRAFLRKNETARGLFLVGIVILGAIAVWGGIRLTLNSEYPILVVSSGSMCPPTNCVLPIGSLIVIRGQDPSTIHLRDIIVFRELDRPDFFIVHRVIAVYTPQNDTAYPGQYSFLTHGDANPSGSNEGPNPASNLLGVYQYTIPVPFLGQAILDVRNFMYDQNGNVNAQGILVILALIIALFAFEVLQPKKKTSPNNNKEERGSAVSKTDDSQPDKSG